MNVHVAAPPPSDTQRVRQLLALIEELIVVVTEENASLARGLPAVRTKQTARKVELAHLFEAWVAEVTSRGGGGVHTNDAGLRAQFMDRMACLKALMDENISRLRAAIEASQRRIEAIMGAIREQISETSPYMANGRIAAGGAPNGTSIRA